METILARRIMVDGECRDLQYVEIERNAAGQIRKLTLCDFDGERPGVCYVSDILKAARTSEGFWTLS